MNIAVLVPLADGQAMTKDFLIALGNQTCDFELFTATHPSHETDKRKSEGESRRKLLRGNYSQFDAVAMVDRGVVLSEPKTLLLTAYVLLHDKPFTLHIHTKKVYIPADHMDIGCFLFHPKDVPLIREAFAEEQYYERQCWCEPVTRIARKYNKKQEWMAGVDALERSYGS